jgi:HSP20 family protein
MPGAALDVEMNYGDCAIGSGVFRRWHSSLCQKFPAPGGDESRSRQKPLILRPFSRLTPLALPKLNKRGWNKQHLTKGYKMKLMHYQRPGLVWPNLGRLLNFDDEFDQLFESPMQAWAPALDVQEDKDGYTIRVELPGMKREDIDVSIQANALVISGERKSETIKDDVEVHRQERYFGKFSRALTLPTAVAGDKVKANYKDGILTVMLPKAEEAKPKQITVSE